MHNVKYFLLLLWLQCAVQSTSGQAGQRFISYSIKDGLSQNSVHAMLKDRDGLMWIGTQDGLNSFNGKNFTIYRHSDTDSTTISDQFVTAIGEDAAGFLWIGTRNGLNRLNKKTGTFTRHYTSEEDKHIFQADYTTFSLLPDNKVLIARTQGVYELDVMQNKIKEVFSSKVFPWSMCFFGTGYQMFFTSESENALHYTPDVRQQSVKKLMQLPFQKKEIMGGTCYKDSILAIFSFHKVVFIDVNKNVVIKTLQLDASVQSVYIHNGNEATIATSDGMLIASLHGKEKWLKANGTNGLPLGTLLCSYRDAGNNFWVGSAANGFAVSNAAFANFEIVPTSRQKDLVTSVAKSRVNNKVYVGARSGLYELGKLQNQPEIPVLKSLVPNLNITAITVDAKGQIWAAVQNNGIHIYDGMGRIVKKINLNYNGSNVAVLHLNTDGAGRLLASTVHGFYTFQNENADAVLHDAASPAAISSTYIMNSFEDAKQHIWVSGNSGLFELTPDLKLKTAFKSTLDDASFLKRTIVCAVKTDLDGNYWIATIRDGIYKYRDGKVRHYNTLSGLSSDVIYNLCCDNLNRIWATTSAGLNVLDKTKDCFVSLSSEDGVPATGFTFSAIAKNIDDILMGTSDGLLICHPSQTNLKNATLQGFVNALQINGTKVSYNSNGIKLMPDNKTLFFDLAIRPAFYTGEVIYQYRLLGQQNEWTTLPAGANSLTYSAFPYKKLSLQVRAAGNVNALATAPVSSLQIISVAPFVKTTWFYVMIGLAGMLLAGTTIYALNKRKYKRQLRLLEIEQQLQVERTRIGRDLHDNIGAYTSALISGIQHIKPQTQLQQTQVNDLKEYGTSMMSFLRETIWMLNTETLTVTAFADRIKNYAMRISRSFPTIELNFSGKISVDKTLQPTVMLNLFRIVQEAFQNACKHANATIITISIWSDKKLQISISDNGKGLQGAAAADSYGILNMKERAAEINYDLQIASAENGTTITLAENTPNAALRS